jgi:hypothetical protein
MASIPSWRRRSPCYPDATLSRVLLIASVTVQLGCANTRPEQQEPEQQQAQPVTFVEQENREGQSAYVAAPIEGIEYWARPTQTADECLAEARAAGIDAKRRVEVSTMTELLAALGSETAILLRPGRYVFEDSRVIHDLHDLALISLGPEPAVIIQPDSYAPVLSFRNVENLALYNLVLGHRPEQGWCMGGVVQIIEGRNVIIAGSTLFGSGTEGLSLVTVDGLTLRDSVITDCTEQFSTLSHSRNVVFERVEIAGNRGDLLRGFAIYRSIFEIRDSVIGNNHPLSWDGGDSSLFAIDGDYDRGQWFVDNPRALEPERQKSEVKLRETSVDGELVNRSL